MPEEPICFRREGDAVLAVTPRGVVRTPAYWFLKALLRLFLCDFNLNKVQFYGNIWVEMGGERIAVKIPDLGVEQSWPLARGKERLFEIYRVLLRPGDLEF